MQNKQSNSIRTVVATGIGAAVIFCSHEICRHSNGCAEYPG